MLQDRESLCAKQKSSRISLINSSWPELLKTRCLQRADFAKHCAMQLPSRKGSIEINAVRSATENLFSDRCLQLAENCQFPVSSHDILLFTFTFHCYSHFLLVFSDPNTLILPFLNVRQSLFVTTLIN